MVPCTPVSTAAMQTWRVNHGMGLGWGRHSQGAAAVSLVTHPDGEVQMVWHCPACPVQLRGAPEVLLSHIGLQELSNMPKKAP